MGRRRSASSTTRLLQGIFALVWAGFLIYMVMGYLKKTDQNEVANENGTANSVEKDETTSPLKLDNSFAALNGGEGITTPTPKPEIKGLTGQQILANTLTAYQTAQAYSDQGKLEVEHQINGRRTKEEYPWSTAWVSDGRFQTDIFDAKIRSNGKMLSCFVSEIRTENLKNQHLFLRGTRLLAQLFQDNIASYYLNGGERIPVNETIVPDSNLFLPPPLALLSGETVSPWFNSSVKPTRLEDGLVDGVDCYVLRCPAKPGEMIAWIDKSDFLIRKVKLPNSLFDPQLATDPNVRELSLTAKFGSASFNSGATIFEPVTPRKGAWPVRQFVAPADPLPTNLLGELASEFAFQDEKRASVTDRDLMGKPIALLFVDGSESEAELIRKFDVVRQNLIANGYRFAVVVGPNSIEKSISGSWRLAPSIQPTANKTKVAFLADTDGVAMQSFELASVPAVVTLDSKLRIQFAELLTKPAGYNGTLAISQAWDQRLASAIQASQKGINVADDMRAKYKRYLDKYFSERDERLVAEYFPGYSLPNQRKVAAVPAKVRREQTAQRSTLKLNPKLVWESQKLASPGNIAVVPDANRRVNGLLVFDGWQTVALFGVDGKPISRKRLNLPEGVAVTSIRPLVSGNGQQRFAMFSVGGSRVYIFDESMELIDTFPDSQDSRESVLACEVLPGSAGSSDQLLVCFGGTRGADLFDTFSGKSRSIGPKAVRALALSGRSVLAVDEGDGSLLSMDDGRVVDDRNEYAHLVSGAQGASVFAATAMNENREWSLKLLDSSLAQKNSFPISSTIFDNGLEPVSGAATTDGKGIWAVADSSNRIWLLSGDGIWLGDMSADGKVSGVKLIRIEGRTRLVVSTDKKIECWELNFAPERVGLIGGRRE